MIELEVEAPVYPTESVEKVEKALKTIVDTPYSLSTEEGKSILRGRAQGLEGVLKIYQCLRDQLIVESARKIMRRKIVGDTVTFHVHKQAAFMGKIHFCQPEAESPMGAIKVTIRSTKIEELVDWLCPKTVDGKPLEREPPIDG
ncbi:MAG: RNA-binding domain-containing protein [Candidatus Freyarchaeota archaeon]|nr:RNA-binding domain-containing protein [Candidatus Freyarchaeota archaeon]